MWRATSAAQIANRRPYVVGTPIWPWVRPAQTRVFVSSLRSRRTEEPLKFLLDQRQALADLERGCCCIKYIV